ncbi:hypothetical protein [Piscirickettsia litoralis]|uniref:Uncharacterized protein n=1 Tax=Piscirickettsia litoralis TaxID=1891921 RepID=A0ABX3A2L2_9GAMM|nr:hypothetical protein [Piscirickettsia litoralis]ODN41886.1 hypothetical protein BGC07_01530 [Piscirickettsia litoralis]
MATKKLALYFYGTWANKDFRSLITPVIVATNSIIDQLYNESLAEDREYYPGPGTSNSYINANWLGGGAVGEHGVSSNVNKAYTRILEKLMFIKSTILEKMLINSRN